MRRSQKKTTLQQSYEQILSQRGEARGGEQQQLIIMSQQQGRVRPRRQGPWIIPAKRLQIKYITYSQALCLCIFVQTLFLERESPERELYGHRQHTAAMVTPFFHDNFCHSLHVVYNMQNLKGLSHDFFRPDFWPVWMHLGLNVNCFLFSDSHDASLILDCHSQNLREGLITFSPVILFCVFLNPRMFRFFNTSSRSSYTLSRVSLRNVNLEKINMGELRTYCQTFWAIIRFGMKHIKT